MLKVLLKKDFRKLAKDPLSLLFLLALPLVITLIARSVFSPSEGVKFVVPLAVVDQDQTPLSGFITGTLTNEKMASLFDVHSIPLKISIPNRLLSFPSNRNTNRPLSFSIAFTLSTSTTSDFPSRAFQRFLCLVISSLNVFNSILIPFFVFLCHAFCIK